MTFYILFRFATKTTVNLANIVFNELEEVWRTVQTSPGFGKVRRESDLPKKLKEEFGDDDFGFKDDLAQLFSISKTNFI